MYCSRCNNMIPDNSTFCNVCGFKVSQQNSPSPQPQINPQQQYNQPQQVQQMRQTQVRQQQPMQPVYQQRYSKICKYCKQRIDKKAKICPYCRKKQGSGLLAAFACVIVVLFLLLFSGACSAFFKGYNDAEKNAEIKQEAQQYSESEYKALCRVVTYEEIARDKNGLEGEKVTLTGEIIQATGDTYRINVTKTSWGYTDTILFEIDSQSLSQNVLEDDIVTIWGESTGMYTYKSVMGAQITVPRIRAVYLQNNGKEKE